MATNIYTHLHDIARQPAQSDAFIAAIRDELLPFLKNLHDQRTRKRQLDAPDQTAAASRRRLEMEELEVPWLKQEKVEPKKKEKERSGREEEDRDEEREEEEEERDGEREEEEREGEKQTEPSPLTEILSEADADTQWYRHRLRVAFTWKDTLQRNVGHIAAHAGNVKVLELLVKPLSDGSIPWDIHASAQGGWKPIHFAACKGHRDCVDLLLKCGVKINVATNRGLKTPYALAESNGHTELAASLKKRGGRARLDNADFEAAWDKLAQKT